MKSSTATTTAGGGSWVLQELGLSMRQCHPVSATLPPPPPPPPPLPKTKSRPTTGRPDRGVVGGVIPDDVVELEHRRSKLQKLYHAAHCKHEGFCGQERYCCASKRLFQHMKSCVSPDCDVPGCRKCRRIWKHYRKCKDGPAYCPLCSAVPKPYDSKSFNVKFMQKQSLLDVSSSSPSSSSSLMAPSFETASSEVSSEVNTFSTRVVVGNNNNYNISVTTPEQKPTATMQKNSSTTTTTTRKTKKPKLLKSRYSGATKENFFEMNKPKFLIYADYVGNADLITALSG